MTREEYEKAKAEDIRNDRSVIDRVPPASPIPAMFIERITRFEITKDKLWKNQRGGIVSFGGVKVGKDWKNKTVIMHPSFSQQLAEAGGVTQVKSVDIKKIYSIHEIPLKNGKIIKSKYCSRVVGTISYRRLTDSASPHPTQHAGEIDIDHLFAAADLKELERIGTVDEYQREYTEKDTSFHTGDEYKDAVAAYAKKLALGNYAYATLATRLRSHGVEKALGMGPLTDSDIGGVIYVSRITYDASDPSMQKMLVGAAIQDYLGVDAQKLISQPQEFESVVMEEDMPNVTESEIPPVTTDDESAAFEDSSILEDIDEDTPPWDDTNQEEGVYKSALRQWFMSDQIKNKICESFVEAVLKSDESEEFYQAAVEAVKLIVSDNEDVSREGDIKLASCVSLTNKYSEFDEEKSKYVEYSVRSNDHKKCMTILNSMTVLINGK